MVNIFIRAIRRAGIPVKYSGGFHPMPRISFNDPLPIGIESEQEAFYLTVAGHIRPAEVPGCLNPCLPDGLSVTGCRLAPSKSARQARSPERYRIRHRQPVFDGPPLDAFAAAPIRILTRTNKKGRQTRIELKEVVSRVERLSSHELEMVLVPSAGGVVRPGEVLGAIFDLPEDMGKQVTVRKLLTAPETEPWTKN